MILFYRCSLCFIVLALVCACGCGVSTSKSTSSPAKITKEEPTQSATNAQGTQFLEWFGNGCKMMGQTPGTVTKLMGREPDSSSYGMGILTWSYRTVLDTGEPDRIEMNILFETDKSGKRAVKSVDFSIAKSFITEPGNPASADAVPWDEKFASYKSDACTVKEGLEKAGCGSHLADAQLGRYSEDGTEYEIDWNGWPTERDHVFMRAICPKPTIEKKMNPDTGLYEDVPIGKPDVSNMVVRYVQIRR